MLTLKVFINSEQIEEINIVNLGHCSSMNDEKEFCDYRVWFASREKFVYVKHNRKKGWKNLVIKALKKLLKEKRKCKLFVNEENC